MIYLFKNTDLNSLEQTFCLPALRVINYSTLAPAETGYQIDSSIPSQRFDFFFLFWGSTRKLKWFTASRLPCRTARYSLFKKANGQIAEISLSVFKFPH